MPASVSSQLFQNAVAELASDQQTSLLTVLELLAQTFIDGSKNDRGDRVRGHIEAEHQLTNDPMRAHPALMKRFLRILLGRAWHLWSPQKRIEKYKRIAKVYACRGQPLPNPPAQLYRYAPAKGFFYFLEKYLREKASKDSLADTLLRLRKTAEDGGDWTKSLRFVQERVVWELIGNFPLTGSPSLFVTFDGPPDGRPSRMSTREIWYALALYYPQVDPPNALVEVRIETDALTECPRFPTLADAGWYACSARS